MTPNFANANANPEDFSYDPKGDVLYITFSREKAVRTVELLADWPMLLVDVNDQNQIIGIEFVGVKQFGFDAFVRLLKERLAQQADKEAEDIIAFMRLPGAEMALAR